MTIEDIVVYLRLLRINLPLWDQQLISSITDQISVGTSLTEKQDVLVRRILDKNKYNISVAMSQDISPFLENPTYRNPIRKISYIKKISIKTNEDQDKIIRVVFPYNEDFVNQIRKHKSEYTGNRAEWDKDQKSWNFSLSEGNIKFLMDFSEKHGFDFDEEFDNLVRQTTDVISDMEKYVTTLSVENSIPYLKNSNKFIPKLEAETILEAIFESRKKGIFTWDDNISKFVDNIPNSVTKEFLRSSPDAQYHVDPEISSIFSLEDVIKYMSPTLFVIPGVDELEKVKEAFHFLKEIGIKNEEMSVVFRLPSETGVVFNNFVKEHQLNSPLTDKTRIVFVSGKLPKPILKSKIKFHAAINMGFPNVHYTLKNYVDNQENALFFVRKKDYRIKNFVIM
jgi:hypothetical protein